MGLTKDMAYAEPEARGFPHSLCSFEAKATLGILPQHLQVSWGDERDKDKDAFTTRGREWTLDVEALSATPELQKLQETLRCSKVVGYLSPLHAVNLPDNAKEKV